MNQYDYIIVGSGIAGLYTALLREESREAHFRSDFPPGLPQWQRHIIFTQSK